MVISKHGGEDTLEAGLGGLKPESAVPSQATRGMVFRSAEPFGVSADGQSVHLGSQYCAELSIDYMW